MSEAVQRVAAIVRADFLIRFRRMSTVVIFLLLSAFAYIWIPDPATGKTLMQIGKGRVLYNSAAIGMATSVLATIFIGLIGFYVTSNAVQRDLNSRCGFVIASTTMKTREYILGKFAGNVVFLITFVSGFMLVSMAMVLVRGEAPLQPLIFAKQYAIVVPSAIVFVAVLSIVFESIKFLSGRFGDVVYFFFWATSLGVVASAMEHGGGRVLRYFDFSSFGYLLEETMRTYHTKQMSIGQSTFDKSVPLRVIDGLHLGGDAWLTRLTSTLSPLLLLGLALLFFHRFDPARVRARSGRNGKWMQRLNAIAKPFTFPLTMLTARGGVIAADARISIASVPLAAIAFIAITIATLAGGQQVMLIAIAPAAIFIADSPRASGGPVRPRSSTPRRGCASGSCSGSSGRRSWSRCSFSPLRSFIRRSRGRPRWRRCWSASRSSAPPRRPSASSAPTPRPSSSCSCRTGTSL